MNALTVTRLGITAVDSGTRVVDECTLEVAVGEIVGLVGETGSGKTSLGLAALGHARTGLIATDGRVEVGGTSLLGAPDDVLRRVRGVQVSYVAQHPSAALNPALRIGAQLDAIVRAHDLSPRGPDGSDRIAKVLAAVSLPAPAKVLDRYPHELSGGQLQRVALAIALVGDPALLVLDEPTTGLDADTTARVLETVRRRATEDGLAALLITHDLRSITEVADRIYVMHAGTIVEHGPTSEVLGEPDHPYTRRLLAALPDPTRRSPVGRSRRPRTDTDTDTVLSLREVAVAFGRRDVLRGATLDVERGEWLAVVGPSAAGKTTLLRAIAGLHPLQSGCIEILGDEVAATARRRTPRQRQAIQMVFQHPHGSFNPRRTVGESVARPLHLAGMPGREVDGAVRELLERVALDGAIADRHPDQCSGGELQRAAIARAIARGPQVLLCDEITSSLDTIVQAAIVELLDEIRRDLGSSIVFVTHDLALAAATSDRVVVVQGGRLLDAGPSPDYLGWGGVTAHDRAR